MKRLLLAPLLLALTSCSNNLTIKTNIGEKMFVKSSTVFTQSFVKSDLINLIEKNLNELENFVYYEEMENKYKIDYKYCDSFPSKCYATKCYENKCYGTIKNFYKENWDKYYELNIKHKKEILDYKNFKNAIVQNKSNMGIKHKILVSFTPVYIDLNETKTVGEKVKIYCFNPLLKEEFKQIWLKESKKGEQKFFENGISFKEICRKYAKF